MRSFCKITARISRQIDRFPHGAKGVYQVQKLKGYVSYVSHLFVCLHLLECPALQNVRQRYFSLSSLKDLFENIENCYVIDLKKEILFLPLTIMSVVLVLL